MKGPKPDEGIGQERAGAAEAAAEKAAPDFESPEAVEKLSAEAAADVAGLEAEGLPVAEQAAARLGAAVDAGTEAELGEIAREAEQAKAELTAGLDPEVAERKETLRETREYRDAEGKLLGTAILEFEPEEVAKGRYNTIDGKPGRYRRLSSFKMRGERDGGETETDLLALAKATDTEIWVGTERMANYFSDSERKYVTSPPLETPFDAAVLLHELGHADQAREERFNSLDKLPKGAEAAVLDSPKRIAETLAQVRAAFPEAGAAIDRIDFRALEEASGRALELALKAGDLERAAEGEAKERDAILRETAMAAFTEEPDLEAFIDRLYNAPDAERAGVLERAGFEFSPDAPPLPEEESWDGAITFGEKEAKPPADLPREAAASYDVARHLLTAFQRASVADVRAADARTGTLELNLSVSVRGEDRLAKLKLVPGAEAIRSMTERQAAKEAEAERLRREAKAADGERAAANAAYEAELERQQVPALVNLARNTLERDATRRAFQWMRTLRNEGGVDLFARTAATKETIRGFSEDDECEPAVDDALTAPESPDLQVSDVKALLGYALGTYGARKFRLKNAEDAGDVGVMPKPGSDRK